MTVVLLRRVHISTSSNYQKPRCFEKSGRDITSIKEIIQPWR